jgi:hypothetical protein
MVEPSTPHLRATLRQPRATQCLVWPSERRKPMLWTIFVILLIMWMLGMVSSYTLGGFIHLLLVFALIVLVYELVTGRRAPL